MKLLKPHLARQRKRPKTLQEPRTEIVPSSDVSLLKRAKQVNPDVQTLLSRFFAGRSKNTLLAYRRDLDVFARYCGESPPAAVQGFLELTAPQAHAFAEEWLDSMRCAGLSSATIARRANTLRNIVKMGRVLGLVSWDLHVRPPRVQAYKDTRGPLRETMTKLIQICRQNGGLAGRRNELILRLLGNLGLRRSEIVSLKLRDYDAAGRRLRVVGKGGDVVWMNLDRAKHCAPAIDLWIKAAGITNPDAPLLHVLRNPDKPISLEGLNYIVMKMGKCAGVHLWPHALRHYTATQALTKGHSVTSVQKLLRHKKIDTTMIYDDRTNDLAGEPLADLDADFGPPLPLEEEDQK